MTSTTKTLYELMPQVNYLEDMTTSEYTTYLLPLTLIAFLFFLPWICDENREQSLGAIAESGAPVCMGHLELMVLAHPGHVMQNGMDKSVFKKFKEFLVPLSHEIEER